MPPDQIQEPTKAELERIWLAAKFMAMLANEGMVHWESSPEGYGMRKNVQLIPGDKLAKWACDYADCLIHENHRRADMGAP